MESYIAPLLLLVVLFIGFGLTHRRGEGPAVVSAVPARIVRANPNAQTKANTINIKTAPNVNVNDNWGQSKIFRVFTLTPIILLCLVLLSACQRDEEQSAELYVFGTIVEIKLWGASPEEAGQAFIEIQQMFQAMHRDWHTWEPGLLVDINKAFAEGMPATADAGHR